MYLKSVLKLRVSTPFVGRFLAEDEATASVQVYRESYGIHKLLVISCGFLLYSTTSTATSTAKSTNMNYFVHCSPLGTLFTALQQSPAGETFGK